MAGFVNRSVFNLLVWLQVFTMNLSAPFICEFFKDAQEKVLP